MDSDLSASGANVAFVEGAAYTDVTNAEPF
jgi:hypothetical protein